MKSFFVVECYRYNKHTRGTDRYRLSATWPIIGIGRLTIGIADNWQTPLLQLVENVDKRNWSWGLGLYCQKAMLVMGNSCFALPPFLPPTGISFFLFLVQSNTAVRISKTVLNALAVSCLPLCLLILFSFDFVHRSKCSICQIRATELDNCQMMIAYNVTLSCDSRITKPVRCLLLPSILLFAGSKDGVLSV